MTDRRSIPELEADLESVKEDQEQIRKGLAELQRDMDERARALVDFEWDIKNELIALRKSQGLSRETVASRMGVSPDSVEEFEHYASHPQINSITHYAMAVNAQLELKVIQLPAISEKALDLLQEEG